MTSILRPESPTHREAREGYLVGWCEGIASYGSPMVLEATRAGERAIRDCETLVSGRKRMAAKHARGQGNVGMYEQARGLGWLAGYQSAKTTYSSLYAGEPWSVLLITRPMTDEELDRAAAAGD